MAQTGYTPILIYSSSTGGNAPAAGNLTNSTLGSELAINITDGKLFYKDNANAVQVIGWKVTPTSAGGTGLTSYTAGDTLYYATGTTLSKLAIGSNGYYMSSSGTAPQWSAPAALTKTDDTNVTLTLGGSASTALLNAASLTLGWTGQLAVTRGGTGLSSVAQGDILYGSASNTLSALAKNTTATRYLSNTGTSNNPAWAQIDLTNGVTGALPAANGGTGQSSYTVGDILYASGTTTLSKLADVATGNALISGGVGVAPSWGKVGLTTHVSGTLGVGNGGTGQTTLGSNQLLYGQGSSAVGMSGNLTWNGTGLGLFIAATTPLQIYTPNQGTTAADILVKNNIAAGYGYSTMPGNAGAWSGHTFVIDWTGSPQLWIDFSNVGTITTTSDYRIKQNVETMPGGAMARVMQLKPIVYEHKDIELWKADGLRREGFLAHELKSVIDSAVSGEKDQLNAKGGIQPQTINETPIIAVLTKAMQELIEEFNAYKAAHP